PGQALACRASKGRLCWRGGLTNMGVYFRALPHYKLNPSNHRVTKRIAASYSVGEYNEEGPSSKSMERAMPSPFPGMNPYLEQEEVWQDFHQSFIPLVRAVLAEQVRPAYVVKVEEHLFIHELSA